jgi:hypothetical protein
MTQIQMTRTFLWKKATIMETSQQAHLRYVSCGDDLKEKSGEKPKRETCFSTGPLDRSQGTFSCL